MHRCWGEGPGSLYQSCSTRRLTLSMCLGAAMRVNCLMVLSHLILNDMMKVKGHIARLALCLQDDCPRVAGLAQVFFHELSRKASKVRAPPHKLSTCTRCKWHAYHALRICRDEGQC